MKTLLDYIDQTEGKFQTELSEGTLVLQEQYTGVGPTTFKKQIRAHSPEEQDEIHNREAAPENQILKNYTRGSGTINRAIHKEFSGEGNIPKAVTEKRKSLDEILDKARLKEHTHVFSGLSRSPVEHFKKTGYKRSAINLLKMHLPSYVSTTTDLDIAKNFARFHDNVPDANHTPRNTDYGEGWNKPKVQHILMLHLPKSARAMSVRNQSRHKAEQEILLHRGHDIEIHPHPSVDKDGTHVWHAVVTRRNAKKYD